MLIQFNTIYFNYIDDILQLYYLIVQYKIIQLNTTIDIILLINCNYIDDILQLYCTILQLYWQSIVTVILTTYCNYIDTILTIYCSYIDNKLQHIVVWWLTTPTPERRAVWATFGCSTRSWRTTNFPKCRRRFSLSWFGKPTGWYWLQYLEVLLLCGKLNHKLTQTAHRGRAAVWVTFWCSIFIWRASWTPKTFSNSPPPWWGQLNSPSPGGCLSDFLVFNFPTSTSQSA